MAKIFFLIGAPDGENNVHLEVLARLSTMLMDENFRNALENSKTPEEFVRIKRVEDELLMTALRTNVAKKPEDPQGPVGPSSN